MNTKISNSEWDIMVYLWDSQPLSMMQIVKKMELEHGWTKSTTTTLLKRMLKKEVITYQQEGKTRMYSAALTKDQVQKEETTSFVNRVFNGNAALMVNHFIDSGNINLDDINELQEILKQAEERLKNE